MAKNPRNPFQPPDIARILRDASREDVETSLELAGYNDLVTPPGVATLQELQELFNLLNNLVVLSDEALALALQDHPALSIFYRLYKFVQAGIEELGEGDVLGLIPEILRLAQQMFEILGGVAEDVAEEDPSVETLREILYRVRVARGQQNAAWIVISGVRGDITKYFKKNDPDPSKLTLLNWHTNLREALVSLRHSTSELKVVLSEPLIPDDPPVVVIPPRVPQ